MGRMRNASILAFAALLASTGCSHDASSAAGGSCDGPCDAAALPPPPDLAVPPDLLGATHFRFILSDIRAPDSKQESTRYLYDVDGTGTKVNKLVAVADALNLAGAPSLQSGIDSALASGVLIQLLDVATLDPTLMNDDAMTVSGYAGVLPMGDDPKLLYSGGARVDLDNSELPPQHTLSGLLNQGKANTLHIPPGSFPLHFPLTGVPPVPLTLYAAHVQFGTESISGDGGPPRFRLVDGDTPAMLNGGISETQIHARLVPAVAQMIQSIIDTDPKSANAMSLLKNFDKNTDGKVSPDEVEMHPVVAGILAPDLDLFDDQGNLAPNQDKVKDSLSFGVGLTGMPVSFDPPK